MKRLATIFAVAALTLGAAVPAGAQAPASQVGCEQVGNLSLAVSGFDAGVAAVDRHGDATPFIRPPRNNMFRCMFVSYNTGVAFARGSRGLPLPSAWAKTASISQAYVAGRAQPQ
jgi:hypothetical protein